MTATLRGKDWADYRANFVDVAIGPLAVRLIIDDVRLAAQVSQRYGVWQSQQHVHATLKISLRPGEHSTCISQQTPFRRGDAFLWQTPTCRLAVYPEKREGMLEGACFLPLVAVEYALRCVVALTAWQYGAVLVHASAVAFDKESLLFIGPSGVGKSTIVRLRPPSTLLLADDLVMLHFTPRGSEAWATPFLAESPPSRGGPYPVSRIYVPVKAASPAVVPMPLYLGLAHFMQSIPILPVHTAALAHVRKSLKSFLHRTPVAALHFPLDPSFWSLILRPMGKRL